MKRTFIIILALIVSAFASAAQETSTDTSQVSIFSVVEVLDEAVTTAEKNRVVYRLDRQKVSGNANLSASGGTAVDVLRSIPSVQVNSEGELSYRGSTGFLVYVDGRQSVLEGTQALQQISAANIEDIEIITTPSARYKTEGDVGIINIVTRKLDQSGFSASLNASGSTIGSWNGDALMNLRKGSSRWYLGLTGTRQKGRSDFRQDRKAIVDDYVTKSLSDGERFSCNSSYIARLGYELNLNSHRILFEAQTGVTEVARGGDLKYDEYRTLAGATINDALYDSKDRYSNEKRLAQLSADYDWKINERGDNLSFRSRFRYDWYALEYTESNMFDESGARYEGTRGYEDEAHWDIDAALAYDLHYRPSGKAEFGYQLTSYSEFGDYSIKHWNRDIKDFQWQTHQDHLAAPFWYRRQLHSLYAMATDKFGPLSVEAGLRGEMTDDRMHFEHTYTSRDIRRWNLFPSAHLSYEAPGRNIISAGYSYRVARPGIWELEPYITYEDYYTKKTGNPDIRPEYIHSAEIGYRKHFGGENVFSVTGFWRQRTDVRERIRTAYRPEPGVTLDSLVNAGNDRTLGIEASATVKPLSWWRLAVNGSVYHYRFISTFAGSSDASIISSGFSMMNNFNLGRTTRMQFDANYVGPRVISQGREKGYIYFDLAVRQALMKNRLAASLVFHDMFRTAKYYSSRISPTLVSETFVRPKYPHIVLSLTYTFNSSGNKEKSGAVSSGAMFEGKDF
jgi:outer membrane receptor protein involved in Fe transport